jgi:hypothetical protein
MTVSPQRRRRDSPRAAAVRSSKVDDEFYGFYSMQELRQFDLAFKEAMLRALCDGLEWPGVYRNKPKEPPP